MGRWIFFALIALLVYWILRRVANQKSTTSHPTSMDPKQGTADTVRCCQCGVYVPRSEALMSKGEFYCESHHPHDLT